MEPKKKGRKKGGTNSVKNASKIIKNHQEKFNKNNEDEINIEKAIERIKNEIEDGENFGSI
jgi:anti-sigma28 factor (negative regulator of flagellin synthesis)